MASGSINLDSVIPKEYELEIPTSSSASILRKSLVGSYPTRLAQYKPYGNNWLEFNVYSPTEFLLLNESYFRFDITRTDLNNGVPSTQYDDSASFDINGVHAIIKSFQVNSGGTATRLDENLYYNTFTANYMKFLTTVHEADHYYAAEGRSAKGERGWSPQYNRQGFYLRGINNFVSSQWSGNPLVLNTPTNSLTTTYASVYIPGTAGGVTSPGFYSLILPPMLLNMIGAGTDLTGATVPLFWAAGTYAANDYVLYYASLTGTNPITSGTGNAAFLQGTESLQFYSNTFSTTPTNLNILPPDVNGNLGLEQPVTLLSIWKNISGSGTTVTPGTNSAVWQEIPFSSLNNPSDARKNVQRGDILDVEYYNSSMLYGQSTFEWRTQVIAVDQLTGIIVVRGIIPQPMLGAVAAVTGVVTPATTYQSQSNPIGLSSGNTVSGVFIKSIFVSQRPLPYNSVPARIEVIRYNNVRYRVIVRIMNAFMELDWPLFVSKNGLNFKIELDFGDRAMTTGLTPTASTNQLDYTIDDPKFFGYFSAPDPSLMRDVINKWNSADGLIYYVPTYTYRELSGVQGEQDTFLNIQPGVRSARGVVIIVQSSEISSVNTALSRASLSLSTALRTNVRAFQANVGAHYFPVEKIDLRENAQVPDYMANEAYHHMYKWVNNRHSLLQKEDFRPFSALYNSSTDSKCFMDAKSFIIYIDLSRSNTANSALTGVDVSITPLQVKLERGEIVYGKSNDVTGLYTVGSGTSQTTSQFGGAPGYPIYRIFIIHDKFIRNSSSVLTALQ